MTPLFLLKLGFHFRHVRVERESWEKLRRTGRFIPCKAIGFQTRLTPCLSSNYWRPISSR